MSVNVKKLQQLDEVLSDVKKCRSCSLCESRNKVVFSKGCLDSDLMIVAESPGQEEDKYGWPLVGRSGKLLDRWMKNYLNWSTFDSYVCNILKCHPPDNRNPLPNEIDACFGFLERQIAIIRPKIILALGAVASKTLLKNPNLRITQERGKLVNFQSGDYCCKLILTFHRAYLLRNGSKENIEKVKSDFLIIKEELTK